MKFFIGLLNICCILPFMNAIGQEITSFEKDNEHCGGYIFISGNTNINDFRLSSQLETIEFQELNSILFSDKNSGIFEIELPLKNFKADNPLIYKDFLELVKANIYPNINIGIEYPYLKVFLINRKDIVAKFTITMAGVTNSYDISCEVVDCINNNLYIRGSETIELSDFNLKPPEKFHGLIKVKDDVIINFGFVFNSDFHLKFTQF